MRTAVAAAAAVVLLAGCGGVAPSAGPGRWVEPVTGMTFARLPAGQFVMGSPADEPGRELQEVPHVVRLARPTWMAVHEVTQGQWRAVMGTAPSYFRGDDARPVERVSWHDARAFAATLSQRSPGSRFRLPTESEWEYACCLHSTMVRTQIQLTDQQARRVRAQARERGLSLAEVIRRYVEKGLADEVPDRTALYDRAAQLVGRHRDRGGKRDISAEHDRYLGEAFK